MVQFYQKHQEQQTWPEARNERLGQGWGENFLRWHRRERASRRMRSHAGVPALAHSACLCHLRTDIGSQSCGWALPLRWHAQVLEPAGFGQYVASRPRLCPGSEAGCPVLLDQSRVIQGAPLPSALQGASGSRVHMPGDSVTQQTLKTEGKGFARTSSRVLYAAIKQLVRWTKRAGAGWKSALRFTN